MADDLLPSEDGIVSLHEEGKLLDARWIDPVDPAVVVETDPARHIITVEARKRWVARRVYSQYLSREVFTDPEGVEWVRISTQAYDPAKGDVEIAMLTGGLNHMLLRRRDLAANNLRKGN